MSKNSADGEPGASSLKNKQRCRSDRPQPESPVAEESVRLSGVSSTLRIPLAARALGDALFPQVAVGDRYAGGVLAALGDDGTQWLTDRHGIYGCLARIRRFRALATEFLSIHPYGHIVNLGCGLSHYFQWLDNGKAQMVDADLPEVLEVRRQLLPLKNQRHSLRAVDLSASDWWEMLDLPSGSGAEPVFLFTEGVLMYLMPQIVSNIIQTIGERAPAGSLFVFDAFCCLIVGQAGLHPSVSHTSAEFLWGPRSLAELRHPHPRLHLQGTHSVMESFGFPYLTFWPIFQALMGVPMYAVYVLRVGDDMPA